MTPETAAKRDAFLAQIKRETAIMGILNVTPDSFSDGGKFDAPQAALAQATRMVSEGCDIVDVGGESTRPGAQKVSAADELERVEGIIAELSNSLTIPVSIDSYKPAVARRAAELGAAVINDVLGLQGPREMAETVADTDCTLIAMHNRPEADANRDIMADMMGYFETTLEIAERAGIAADRIILDPGIGFGKTLEQNLICIRELGQLRAFGKPVLLGLSRKSFIGKLLDTEVDDRLTGTLIADLVGLRAGAHILRVHDVKEHRQMLTMLNALEGQP